MDRKILRSQAAGAFRNNILAGVILLFLYVLGHSGFGTDDMKGICLIWGDGFTMTGVLLLGTAGITLLNRLGYLDWACYGVYLSGALLSRKKNEDISSFYEYRTLREHKKASVLPAVGVSTVWICIGLLLSMLYYQV